jgi:glycine/D-amino acid oxidase-like deaminating enzyme/nitrite reductase/ring-hydroxylating ferredoxin subunit
VERERIDCHFRSVDGYLFAHPTDSEESLPRELEATQTIGCPTRLLTDTPGLLHGTGKQCLHFPEQGQLHSLLYLQGLADAILRMGGQIYTQSRAEQITSEGAEVNGYTVQASHIVVTTNTTVNNILRMHTKQWPYRSYAMAFRVPAGSIAPALWWDTGKKDVPWVEKPYHYVRTEAGTDGSDYLIAGGEDHRTGQEDQEEVSQETRYDRIAAWTKAHFPGVSEVVARWSGQIMYSIDGLGFAGRNPGSENMYIITGDSGNGMTNATTGARIITDCINGRENASADLFDPSRTVAKHGAGSYLRETANMLVQYGDWFTPGDPTTAEALQPGEGAVIRKGLKKLAVYRDANNQLHTCSAVCPHLGAILHWNKDEHTFDCPLHGSRFTGEGKVVNGPANEDLGEVKV